MVNIKLSGLLDKGVIVQEQLIKILQRHEDALANAGEGTAYDDTEVKADISALKTAIGSEEVAGTILARIKALEDAQTPADP